MNNQNYLTHHGILGMKWGVRRSKAQLARARGKESSEETHDDYKKAHSKKSVKSMSDKELRDINNRLLMETQYNKFVNSKKESAGKKFVTEILSSAGKQALIPFAAKYMTKGLESLEKSLAGKGG